MGAIRVGNTRVNLALVAYVQTRISEALYKPTWNNNGEVAEWYDTPTPQQKKDHGMFSGMIVTAYFAVSGGESDMFIRFYGDEADEFIELYDECMKTEDTQSIRA